MPLKVLIVGAGIVGLSAAIALAREGHDVEIFEKSAFLREIGAAFHFAPQVVKILRLWGVDMDAMRPVQCECVRYVDDLRVGGEAKRVAFAWSEKAPILGVTEPQIMMHRVDAHSALREHVLAFPNVKLHLSSALASVDPTTGLITLADGTTHAGDLIVGADGIHSAALQAIERLPTRPSGIRMYRFLVPTSAALADARVRGFLDGFDWQHTLTSFASPATGHALVMYPCRGGALINCATFQPAKPGDDDARDAAEWNRPASAADVLRILDDFPDHFKRLIALADEVKHWVALDRDSPKTFVSGRLVVVGDAAHSFPPTHAAGAGTGVEEAATLSVLFGRDQNMRSEDVQARLETYNRLRYKRGLIIKYASEMRPPRPEASVEKLRQVYPGAEVPEDMVAYLWTHDAMEEARAAVLVAPES